eukprot:TRINITY_DN3165_c0_g1_i5.p1 TRINITY_DN3165_c0_g1~~TRINITY_DN3165_c0_g1_i5.p1  ORF type:complete len:507 (+),score=126.01 TRINITY_DN3165_c0_g1_i5:879-2399(+)
MAFFEPLYSFPAKKLSNFLLDLFQNVSNYQYVKRITETYYGEHFGSVAKETTEENSQNERSLLKSEKFFQFLVTPFNPLNLSHFNVLRSTLLPFTYFQHFPENFRIFPSIIKRSQAPVILVCGKKNIGKSTYTKILSNMFLNGRKTIGFLDFDLGQPEFTISGLLSLILLNQEHPIFGPSFTHTTNPDYGIYLGKISPEDDIEYYLDAVSRVVEYSKQYRGKMPIIVNTHGWIKGVGYSILMRIIEMISPTDIIQLYNSKFPRDSNPCETRDLEQRGFLPFHNELPAEHLVTPKTIVLHSVCSVPVNETLIKTSPSDERTLRIISYFKEAINNPLQTFSVPWHSLYFKFIVKTVPPSAALWALNGTIVALSTIDPKTLKNQVQKEYSQLPEKSVETIAEPNETYPKFLPPNILDSPLTCIGMGIIKWINPKQQKIALITPLSFNLLKNVNLIIRGSTELPALLLISSSSTRIPYISSHSVASRDVGASTIQSKKFVKRAYHRQQNL